jgi:hypothetical protein
MPDRSDEVEHLRRLIDRLAGRSDGTTPAPSYPGARPGRSMPSDAEWQELPPAAPPPRGRPGPAPAQSTAVTWGTGGSVLDDPLHFVGQIDPLEGTPLVAGEQASVCTRCGAAYHLATMSFIRGATGGACVSCGTAGMFRTITLVAGSAPVAPTPAEVKPPVAPPPAPTGVARDAAGRPIIQLHQVRDHIGEEVAFEGRVLRVHLTGGGAHFLYFERAARVLDGFRAVIRPRDIFHWEVEGIVPAEAYPDQWVRIVGRVVDDPRWQMEILVQRPESIQVIDAPTEPTGWRTQAGIAPSVPPVRPAPAPRPPAPDPAPPPRPRIRWID